MATDEGVGAPVARSSYRTAHASKAPTIALLAAMLVVHNAQRTGVVPLFTDLQPRFGTDYAGIGTLFAAYVFGYAIFQAIVGLIGDRLTPGCSC